jgi:hypothetical protein
MAGVGKYVHLKFRREEMACDENDTGGATPQRHSDF